MENSSAHAINISSDEEPGFSGNGDGAFDDSNERDWLSELLGEVNANNDVDDSDEVVIVSQVFPETPKKSMLQQSLKPSAEIVVVDVDDDDDDCAVSDCDEDDDDDDCVVLECDPEKTVLAENTKGDEDDDDSDDLEIVGEKGEVACRDFPHSRHLCGIYLFASTPHEVHCSQCHCYVCDSIAPCDNWDTGTSSIDHCHATDKEEFWRLERKSRKEGNSPVPLIPSISNRFMPAKVPALSQSEPNSLLPSPTWSPFIPRPCSVPSNNRTANIVRTGRCYPVGHSIPRYKPQHQSYSPEIPTYNSHGTSSFNTTNRNARHYSSRVQFKRTAFNGVSQNNRHRHLSCNIRSQLSGNSSQRRSPASSDTWLNGYHFYNEQGVDYCVDNSMFTQLESSLPPSIDVSSAKHIPSLPQILTPPISSFQLPSQSDLSSSNFLDVLPFQSHVPPPISTSSQLDARNAFKYQLNSTSTVSSHPNMGNTFENQSYQPDRYDNISPVLTNGPNNFQLGDQTQSGLDTSAVHFGSDWRVSHSHINSQASVEEPMFESAVPACSAHNQSILELEDDHHRNVAPVENYHRNHVPPAASNPSVASSSHFSGVIDRDQLDAKFESWMLENPSSPVGFEGPLQPYWHSPSPEHDSIAALFYI